MQYSVSFDFSNLHQVQRSVQRALQRPQQLLSTIGESLLIRNQDRHLAGLAPDGTPWTPLAPATLHAIVERRQHQVTRIGGKKSGAQSDFRAAQKIMGSKRILFDHGDLLRFHYQLQGRQVVIGTNDYKAVWHHFGTGSKGPSGQSYEIRPKVAKALHFGGRFAKRVLHPGVPARPLVGMPAGDAQDIADLTAEHLTTVLRRL
jgi:phage gpG-like protein